MRDCLQITAPTVGGRIFVDVSSYSLSSAENEWRANLYWAFSDVPDGTEIVVRVGRTLPNLDSCCLPQVDVLPRLHIVIEGPDAQAVRTAVGKFRIALTQWAERTEAELAERQEREAREVADRAWLAQRRAATT